MRLKRSVVTALIAAAVLICLSRSGFAQDEERFKARLSPVPIDRTMRAIVTGKGAVSAVLIGHRLSINGTFEGLAGPATVARLHLGLATGVRGSAFHDLTVTKKTSGTITASLDLTPEQMEGLEKGKVYVQIHSEKTPDGNLWGWLLRQ